MYQISENSKQLLTFGYFFGPLCVDSGSDSAFLGLTDLLPYNFLSLIDAKQLA